MTNKKEELHELAKRKGWKHNDFPEWGNNSLYLTTISGGYLLENETPREAYIRLSKKASELLNKPELEEKFFNIFWNGWLIPATPVMANFGTDLALPISCFSGVVDDSLYDINRKNMEMAMLSKYGGGTAYDFSRIREIGSKIKNGAGGTSDGIIPFIKQFDSTIIASKQAKVRRGAVAIYLNAEHKEYLDFLEIREPKGDINRQCHNIHQSGIFTDEFMEKVIDKNGKEREIWLETLKKRVKTGEPYTMFIDNANKVTPEFWKNNNLTIKHSNLCVAPETELLTDKGYIVIGEHENEFVNVWNGNEYSNTQIVKTGVNQKLIKINFSIGESIECTEYHKFYIDENGVEIEVRAKDLKAGDKIYTYFDGIDVMNKVCIDSIEDNNRYDDTYCVNEPKQHKVIFNGILTGNCSEIFLPTDSRHTLVCCLSSLNLVKFDEWKDTDTVYLATMFLDAVMQDFINKGTSGDYLGIEDATSFAIKSRALGLGTLGWHSFLQSKMIPFISIEANSYTHIIFKHIRSEAERATMDMGKEYGEPEWCKGTGRRNLTLLAIAPNRSSSKLCGNTSQGVEPLAANVYMDDDAKGLHIRRNPFLEALLETKGKNIAKVWDVIAEDKGSVLNVRCLTKEEKDVFKTFKEINQLELVRQAGIRQKFIDQGQSINLAFFQDAPAKFINQVHIEAWKVGLKALYYLRSESTVRGDSKEQRDLYSECIMCEA